MGRTPKVALVHDWLTGMRGGEKVLEVLCEMYPSAALFTLVHVPGSVSPTIERLRPRTSIIQRLPLAGRHYRQYLPLFPTAIELFDLDDFDLIVSTSHCAAKAVVKSGRARHVCYCHTPMRYAWDQFDAYFGLEQVGPVKNTVVRPIMAWLARWDAATATRVDRFIANSQHVAKRIRRYYNRSANVVYPPVDTSFFHPDGASPEPYFLVVSALVPYKRLDVAIEACRIAHVPLKIVGTGPEHDRLSRLGQGVADLLGSRSDDEIRDLYRRAAAVLLPGEEDFGIVPVEAQACGRPVVALARGGALETVEDAVNGILVEEGTAQAFAHGMNRLATVQFDPVRIRQGAERFCRPRFAEEIRAAIEFDAPVTGVPAHPETA